MSRSPSSHIAAALGWTPHPSRIAPAFALAILLLSLPSCRKEAPPVPQHEVTASELPQITIDASAKLLFIYYDGKGTFTSTTALKDVPQSSRGWVRVVDLHTRPDRRLDHELVYVADLRKRGKNEHYPYIVMSREAFESAASSGRAPGASEPAAHAAATDASTTPLPKNAGVVLYGTSWCGVCKRARAWLQQRGTAFIEKDIEADPAAAAELMEKARKAGISPSGVPVIDVHGTLLQGFDPARLTALLGEST